MLSLRDAVFFVVVVHELILLSGVVPVVSSGEKKSDGSLHRAKAEKKKRRCKLDLEMTRESEGDGRQRG
jgi:hypothetical protein